MTSIKIATRESRLALWQANYVRDRLLQVRPDLVIDIIGMTTQGDRNKISPLSEIGGKGVFVKELELALLNGEADIAVHSMKDVPSELPAGLAISAICERADPRDAFISSTYDNIDSIPPGGSIGSSSLRRRLQLKACYPQLDYIELRGNVETRLRKLDEGEFDGIILAAAGLQRLGLEHRISQFISVEDCIPSAGQGAVGIESRCDDNVTNDLMALINHLPSELCVSSERRITSQLGATCNLPIAVFAQIDDDKIKLRSFVSNTAGDQVLRFSLSGPLESADTLAEQVAARLLADGAAALIQETST